MQLRMTAPMDIGMEQSDAALRGHDDMFELDDAASRALRGRRPGAGYDDDDTDEEAPEAAPEADGGDEDVQGGAGLLEVLLEGDERTKAKNWRSVIGEFQEFSRTLVDADYQAELE